MLPGLVSITQAYLVNIQMNDPSFALSIKYIKMLVSPEFYPRPGFEVFHQVSSLVLFWGYMFMFYSQAILF